MSASIIPGIRVAGVASAVPSNLVNNDGASFSAEEIDQICASSGVRSRRVSGSNLLASDLGATSAERLLKALGWNREDIGALVFVTQTPDYWIPPSACLLQQRLGLPKSCAAFDVTLGCSGYIYGLWIVSSLLKSLSSSRALLVVGDTISRLVSSDDRATALLFGDAGSATAIERTDDAAASMAFVLGTDGSGAEHLMVRGGGFRNPSEASTLCMDGGEVFAFSLRVVPKLIKELLAESGWGKESVDGWVFHQANAFMLEHLAKRLRLASDRVVVDLEGFGNTTSVSIPLALSNALSERLSAERMRLVLAGFGVGLSWGAVAMECGPIVALPPVEVDTNSQARLECP